MAYIHITLQELTAPQIQRFKIKIKQGDGDGCWEWQGRRDFENYGTWQPKQMSLPIRAHRVAYFLNLGVDPGKLCVLHECDNPPCCNPNHLRLGTNLENTADRVRKNRSARGQKVRPKRSLNGGYKGEGHPSVKLTNEQVLEIRAKYVPRKYPSRRLAREYGVDKSTILLIVKRKKWTHI